MVLLQRLKGTESHCTIIRHQALAHWVLHTSAHHLHPTAVPTEGEASVDREGSRVMHLDSLHSPAQCKGRCCPMDTTPIHPQQEGSLTFRKLFKSLIAFLSEVHTCLFPADINLRDLSSTPHCQIEVTFTSFTGHLSSFLLALGLLQAKEKRSIFRHLHQ